jgi:DNA-directed RNA polymerase specialized sigma24 family protein
LVDQAFDQTIKRLPHIIDDFQGEPAKYIYVVAIRLLAKYFEERSKIAPLPDPDLLPDPAQKPDLEAERAFECIERCLSRLQPEQRRLFENYYREIKNAGKYRRQLAEELRLPIEALRLKAFRIKEIMRVCTEECLESGQKLIMRVI